MLPQIERLNCFHNNVTLNRTLTASITMLPYIEPLTASITMLH